MIGCLWTRVRKQPIIALYFEFETVFKFYNLEARSHTFLEIDHGHSSHSADSRRVGVSYKQNYVHEALFDLVELAQENVWLG